MGKKNKRRARIKKFYFESPIVDSFLLHCESAVGFSKRNDMNKTQNKFFYVWKLV